MPQSRHLSAKRPGASTRVSGVQAVSSRYMGASTDPWQLLARDPVEDAAPAEGGLELDEGVRVLNDGPDPSGFRPQRMRAHGRDESVAILGRADRQQLPLVRHVERVQA